MQKVSIAFLLWGAVVVASMVPPERGGPVLQPKDAAADTPVTTTTATVTPTLTPTATPTQPIKFDLYIEVDDSDDPVFVTQHFRYIVRLGNYGPTYMGGVSFWGSLSHPTVRFTGSLFGPGPGVVDCDVEGQSFNCASSGLEPLEELELDFEVEVVGPSSEGYVSLCVEGRGGWNDTNPDNNSDCEVTTIIDTTPTPTTTPPTPTPLPPGVPTPTRTPLPLTTSTPSVALVYLPLVLSAYSEPTPMPTVTPTPLPRPTETPTLPPPKTITPAGTPPMPTPTVTPTITVTPT